MIELSEIPSYLSGPLLVCALVAFGLVVGVLTGLFGVGGGFVVTPLLNVLLGIPYNLSVGSSLSFIVGTSAADMAPSAKIFLRELGMPNAVTNASARAEAPTNWLKSLSRMRPSMRLSNVMPAT